MDCSNCGAAIPEGQPTCVQCLMPAHQRPPLLSRLRSWLFRRALTPQMTLPTATLVHRVEHIEVTDSATGKRQVFNSLDAVPPDIRAKIDALRATTQPAVIHQTLTFRDPSGVAHTCDSLDELPPDVRAIYEQLLQAQVRTRSGHPHLSPPTL